ncbi:MBOAT, membrane-bound O-acyltransferase family-domain-containing protein [Lasiosphaeris hirsuta]|uniref:MBOAT, membrane-bound O-acyltransferase family-domain-containing protein n=1 Tax=Lasiosphaeris hirsuta TaxID=260670 RepID=A0AA40ECJ1_9PEZI|nr:MBOAT, membrane-bound O-acyltransferase family-domain-containing protein [Lasiosphaeris hirsuta]
MAPGFWSFVGSVYDMDTLDTRFTTPSTVAYRGKAAAAADKRDDQRSTAAQAQPSRWGTLEFYLYYVVVCVAIPAMLWYPYTVSRPSDPRYHKYQQLLDDGWIPGRKIDVSDAQYHTTRVNLKYMAALIVVHPLLRKLYNRILGTKETPQRPGVPLSPESAETRKRDRVRFDFGFALAFLVVLHGFSAAKVLLILVLNYKIGTQLPKRLVPPATWAFNIFILLSNELCNGYKYRSISLFLSNRLGEDVVSGSSALVQLGEWMDSHGGLISRWEILFNLTILRLISYNLDYYWSLDRRSSSPVEKQLDPANLSERDRVNNPAPAGDYNFVSYVAYTIYAPLYLAGPIMTFNDYISQQRYRSATIETPRTVRYAIRFVVVVLTLEVLLHFHYVSAILKSNPDWRSYSPPQLSLLSLFNLFVVWLKLLLPWRFFRLWSLVDGIDPPENMIRCIANNYSTLSFWRGWHRSYYRWLLRYIYIPLGGSSFSTVRDAVRSIVTYLVVFTFVALWHDIKLNMVIWSWLIVAFFLPEISAGLLFPKRNWTLHPTTYRMLCCVGGVANMFMMIAANLVGFAVGPEGLKSILEGIFKDINGLTFLALSSAATFVGIQVMFEIRESEKKRGINLKC